MAIIQDYTPLKSTAVSGVERLIADAIKNAIAKSIDLVVEDAKLSVEKQIRGSVGDIAARVLQKFSFDRMGQDLVIRVEFPGAKT